MEFFLLLVPFAERKGRERSQMRNNVKQCYYITKYLFGHSRALVIFSFIWAVVAAIPAVLSKLLVKWILDAFTLEASRAFRIIWLTAGFLVFYEALNAVFTHLIFPLLKKRAYQSMLKQILKKAVEIDISCYDTPKVYQSLEWAKTAIDTATFSTLDTLGLFITNMTKLIFLFAVFVHFNMVYLLFALVAFCLIYGMNRISATLSAKMMQETMEYNRMARYCNRVFTSVKHAKELRLYHVGRVIMKKFASAYSEKLNVSKRYLRKIATLEFLSVTVPGYLISEFCLALVLGYQIICCQTGTLGDFTLIYSGIDTILAALFSIVGPVMGGLARNVPSITHLQKFFALQPEIRDGDHVPTGREHRLDVRDVVFSYGNSGKPVFNGLNLIIPPRGKVAIVGANGSGKSTLIKLLLRLYDVKHGSIKLDGVDICSYRVQAYRALFSCIFQNPQTYALSVGENIAMDATWDENQMKRVVTAANFLWDEPTEELLRKPIFKYFDAKGLILSGGQSQQIVLARLFYHGGEILIMDEPSASLDPASEYAFNRRVVQEFSNRTILLVTHRLSAVKDMDIIYFLQDGQVVEVGTHRELLELNGAYSAMWRTQAERFTLQSGY